MRKGEVIRAALIGVALLLALTGDWGLLFVGAVLYQVGRVAAAVLEQRSHRRREGVLHG